ncbi:MAG: nucleotide exchange factor GrpE [Rhodobacteraceae bacterium]|nr:nucleotide exchange factor GrpE [Paracoccaceae bacterium]
MVDSKNDTSQNNIDASGADLAEQTTVAVPETKAVAESGAADSQVSDHDALRAERDELNDRLLRCLAESENARKRAERDRREAEQYGGSRLARDLLPIYDNLRRALEAVGDAPPEEAAGVIEGVELTLRELKNIFENHNLTAIKPRLGDSFDPQLHQAMFEAPAPGTKAGEIIQVMTEGFKLHDRLLRPAQVGVSSTPAG